MAGSSGSRVKVYPLDVTQPRQIQFLAHELRPQPIDILMNNAGLRGLREKFGDVDESTWIDVLKVNTIAPLKMAEAFVDHVARSERKILATVSSDMGSIQKNRSGRDYIYRSSKAAVNAVMKNLSIDLKNKGIIVVTLHPGWVETAMGGERAPLSVEKSVTAMRSVLASVTLKDTGKFYGYDGSEIPW